MKIDIGEILRKRVAIFPALEKEPKRPPSSWGLFPTFTLTPEQLAETFEYRYPVTLRSGSPAELQAMVDRAINAGRETIESGDFEIWLYATSITPTMRIRGTPNSEIRLTYIVRAKRVIFAPAETPSGSIVEVPREPTPEDLERKEPKEEVKNG